MSPRVKLSDIINIIRFQSYNASYYLDKKSGELFLISKEQLRAAKEDTEMEDLPEWKKAQFKLAREILSDKKGKKYIGMLSIGDVLRASLVSKDDEIKHLNKMSLIGLMIL